MNISILIIIYITSSHLILMQKCYVLYLQYHHCSKLTSAVLNMTVHNALVCLSTRWSMCGNPSRPWWPESRDLRVPDPVVTLLLLLLTWHPASLHRLQLPYPPPLLCCCSTKTSRRLKYAGDHAASCVHVEIIGHFGRRTFIWVATATALKCPPAKKSAG